MGPRLASLGARLRQRFTVRIFVVERGEEGQRIRVYRKEMEAAIISMALNKSTKLGISLLACSSSSLCAAHAEYLVSANFGCFIIILDREPSL